LICFYYCNREVDGYNAIQVGFADKQAYKKDAKSNKYANKPAEGHANSSTLTFLNSRMKRLGAAPAFLA
jgi:ribosomal protein L3